MKKVAVRGALRPQSMEQGRGAEGRFKSLDGGNTANYVYNALGGWRRRWARPTPKSCTTNRANRWARNLAIYQNNTTYFTHVNSVGSTVMVSDYTGAIVEDKLFYPWGQDWQAAGTLSL